MATHIRAPRRFAAVITWLLVAAALAFAGTTANAAIVPTVPLATAANYAVLGGSTVTNTGNTVLNGSLGLWPGTSITGFPPGQVVPPGTTDNNNAAAQQAQSDLTAAYTNAAGRPLDATTAADLVNLTLQGGVYAGPNKGALSLSGPLTLDGAGNMNSVFIFQTNASLTTATGSTVTLINGAQECNVFWQVGSSATLGNNSVFVGNILALTAITVNSGATVRGRALTRNAAVTLNNNTFNSPTCAQASAVTTTSPTTTTTTTSTSASSTTTTTAATTATTTATAGTGATTTSTTTPGASPTTTAAPAIALGPTGTTATPRGRIAGAAPLGGTAGAVPAAGGPRVPGVVGPPRTGGAPLVEEDSSRPAALFAGLFGGAVVVGLLARRRLQVRGGSRIER